MTFPEQRYQVASTGLAFFCPPRKLKLRQVWQLEPLRVREEEFGILSELAQDFRAMVAHHQAEYLPRWLEEAKASGIAERKQLRCGDLSRLRRRAQWAFFGVEPRPDRSA